MVLFVAALSHLYAGEWQGAEGAEGSEGSEGQGLVEYAIIVALTAILVIVALIFLRQQITTLFSKVGNSLS